MPSPNILTPSMLANLEVPHELHLSPSDVHVIYTVRSDWNRPHANDRWLSSIWIAEIGKRDSAHWLTVGESLDSWPQFSFTPILITPSIILFTYIYYVGQTQWSGKSKIALNGGMKLANCPIYSLIRKYVY